jgi:hypothetical protein
VRQPVYRLTPADPVRCNPSPGCGRKWGCLRFRAEPEPGQPVTDYQLIRAGLGACTEFLPLPETNAP